MKTLQLKVGEIGFVEREKYKGEYVRNKCGRDFIYFALNFYHPNLFNPTVNNPCSLESNGLLGLRIPSILSWTLLQFTKLHDFLTQQGLILTINDVSVRSFTSFIRSILFSRKTYISAVREIEESIDQNMAVGVDLSLGFFGLNDHVMFVYGCDEDNLYVVDTHFVNEAGYEKSDISPNVYRLPKKVLFQKWSIFSRVWKISKISSKIRA
jgi:hypothetical protein